MNLGFKMGKGLNEVILFVCRYMQYFFPLYGQHCQAIRMKDFKAHTNMPIYCWICA